MFGVCTGTFRLFASPATIANPGGKAVIFSPKRK
jgi:hypothetical protein